MKPLDVADDVRRSDSPFSTGTLELVASLVSHIPTNRSVLEVGSGNGHLSELIVSRNNRLLGVDISQAAIEACRGRLGDRASFVQGDLRELALEQRFEYAFINEVLDQIPDDEGILGAVFRVLEPGGRLVLSTPVSKDRFCKATIHFYTLGEIRGKIVRAGFVLEDQDVYGGVLGYLAAFASQHVRFSTRLLAAVRKSTLYRGLMAVDAKLKLKGDRVILVGRKPST